ncbi:hypothetical protein B0J13DRAFT_538000 [Dactylonectria estremocensis]|uniref:DNA polymerase lambda n=1 Tax=Dactylonectria estremocensis TaxID=1079267 RepID=A0A9P9FIA5_9HYPO|nr:hypothetical protein B0J13DRAFT_538000 [Dactylonectria estremocensis]
MPSFQEKVAFFDQLKTNYSDDEFDDDEQNERKQSRCFFTAKAAPPSAVPREPPIVLDLTEDEPPKAKPIPRRVSSVSTPVPSGSAKIIKGTPITTLGQKRRVGALLDAQSADVILVDETPIPDSTRPARRRILRGDSTPIFPSKRSLGNNKEDSPSSSIAMKKRKREPSMKLRPEEQQLFRNLLFFYVPDNDIAPARRLRITKAREFGATWTRNPASATHIVVEKNIAFKEVDGVLRSANKTLPPEVVNEDYPLDCIQFKALLQCNQKKYQLTGQPTEVDKLRVSAAPPISSEPNQSAQSLPLKSPQRNPRKWDYLPPIGTPTGGEESPQPSCVTLTPMATDSQPLVLDLDGLVESPKNPSEEEEPGVGDTGGNQAAAGKKVGKGIDSSPNVTRHPPTGIEPEDELTEYIALIQEYKDLPLDAEEEDGHSGKDAGSGGSEAAGASGSEDDQIQKRRRDKRKTGPGLKGLAFEDRFACNSAGAKDAKAGNPNTRIIEVLQLMADYYDRVNDHWRTAAYRKAISTLKRQDVKVTTEEEALRLPNIGSRLAQKIEEIVTTDKLKRLEYARDEPMDKVLQRFLGIYGVGNHQAQQWIAQGFRTLEDLKQKAHLTQNQLVGVDHYDDLNTRIPRREVEALGEVVRTAAQRIDPQVHLIIGGSYRRGAETSGDIDFIVTKPGTDSCGDLRTSLDAIVQRLEAEQFLVARLASSRTSSDGSKWHGCCVLPKITGFNDENYRPTWRRIDFLLVPESEMGAALIYFTGNDIFNRSMRLLASKKGMRLNQRGLYKDVMCGPQLAKVTEGELVEGRDERKIFQILGVKWREPHERWC